MNPRAVLDEFWEDEYRKIREVAMSRAADAIKKNLKAYVERMRELGKEPSALYVTKAQFDILRADAKHPGDDYRPRFMGIEVKKHDR